MSRILFQKVKPDDKKPIELIAGWYEREWKIASQITIQKISSYPAEGIPFQILMTVDGLPVATGGLYHEVGLLDYEPKYRIYGPWLALVYTAPKNRNKGYGALLCQKIQEISKDLGLKEIFLYTFTAETLYKQLGWEELERTNYKGKDAVVMKKKL
jgi:GNAT superfamily N-acetyltransferase